ncbi:HupE/UreJ family protein [Aquirufa sp. ROCK-SH2]
MQELYTYFLLGLQHILNIMAVDHLLFILSFVCVYTFANLKHTFYLVTAFTLGHSITLALATFKLVNLSQNWIEFLIPCTILLSALANFSFEKVAPSKEKLSLFKYVSITFFGLIHGLGFSNYLQSLLGQEQSIFKALFSFNVGLEIGQIVALSFILLVSSIVVNVLKIKHKSLVLVVSGMIIGLCLPMIFERVMQLGF